MYREGRLSICSPVFAELLAALGRTGQMLDSMLQDAGVRVDWNLDEPIRGARMPRTLVIAACQPHRFFRSRLPGLTVVIE